MHQIIEQNDDEKMKMYMKQPKKKLAEMLIQCNKIIDSLSPTPYVIGVDIGDGKDKTVNHNIFDVKYSSSSNNVFFNSNGNFINN